MTHSASDGASIGQTRKIGVASLVAFLISASAPMTVLAGGIVVTFAVTGVIGVPLSFPILAVALGLFTVGYAAMSRYIFNAGAFYAYIAEGLGRIPGVAGAGVALLAYNAIQIGLYGLFGAVTAGFMASEFEVTSLSWWGYSLIAWAVVGILGTRSIDLSSRVLTVLLVLEVIAVLVFNLGAFVEPAGGSIGTSALWPGELLVDGVGGVFAFGIAAFVGFESGAAYARDVKDPGRTVARATYITLAVIGVMYAVTAWAVTVAVGSDQVVEAARDPAAGVPFAQLAGAFGDNVAMAANLLLITSVFAALLSFHNTTARYTYALGRDGVLPPVLGRAGLRSGSPIAGSLLQSVVAVVVVLIFVLLDRDPVVELFTWFSYIAAVGLLLIMIVVSVAVIGFFNRRTRNGASTGAPPPAAEPETAWQRIVAPVLSAVVLLAIFVITVSNADSVLGAEAGSALVYILPGIVPVAALVFALLGLLLKARNPAAYQNIGSAGEGVAAAEGTWHGGGPHPERAANNPREDSPMF